MSSDRFRSFAAWSVKEAPRGLLLGLALTLSVSAAERLTLEESLDRARKNNPQLLLAAKDLSVARTQVRQARSLYYPKVNLRMDYVRYRNETLGLTSPDLGSLVLEAPIQNPDDTRSNPLSQNLYVGRLGFVQTLYAGGKVTATHRLSQAGLRRAESMVDTVRQSVECQTAQNFYRLIALSKQKSLLSSTLVDIDKLAKQGGSSHTQLAFAAAQSETQQRLSDVTQLEQTVRFNYLQSMGLELFSDVEVAGELEAVGDLPDLQTALVWAKQNRAELKETQIQEEVDHLTVELSRAERYPVFLLGGGLEVRNDEFPLDETNWNTALSMNIPIFDGFSSYARVRESRYRADQGRLRRVQLEDQVELEVRTAHSEWNHWKNEVNVRRRQWDMLEQSRRQAFQSAGAPERLDYLRWRADAGTRLIDAEYELCAAQARLSKAVGRPIQ